jgi:hypothetical protein
MRSVPQVRELGDSLKTSCHKKVLRTVAWGLSFGWIVWNDLSKGSHPAEGA